ncbi:MAG: hypothetical protein KKD39_05490 [Candidatus Altiarchaeota archaeon]|nr:hypothetical protein [Candidatus Altiarchaeota archaeon]
MLSVLLVYAVETQANKYTSEFNPKYLDKIISEKPDLVLIGNSMLGYNVNETVLEQKLANYCEREVNVVFITSGGQMSAWWYLVLKNHVLPANISKTPVGVFYRDRNILDPKLRTNGIYLTALRESMKGDETLYFEKTGIKMGGFPKFILQRDEIKSKTVSYILKNTMETISSGMNLPKDVEAVFSVEKFEKTVHDNEGVEHGICAKLSECADETLLPDMIDVMENNTLFFVQVHRNPEYEKITWRYEDELREYFTKNNIPRIALHMEKQLNDSEAYYKHDHLTHEGILLNTEILAEKIVELKVLNCNS